MRFYIKRVDNDQYMVYTPSFKDSDHDTSTGVEVFKNHHELENFFGRMCVCSITDSQCNEYANRVLKVDIESVDIDHFDFFIDKKNNEQ